MKEKITHASIIFFLGALIYSNSLNNHFVWNDWELIIRNNLIRSWGNLSEILTNTEWKPLVGEPSHTYRPLLVLTYMMDFALWSSKPFGYHLTNVTLHLLNGLLVYFLLRRYVHPNAALLGAVLFIVHPAQTEAVTYISGRGEPLMFFLLFSGLLLFTYGLNKPMSWLFYLASLSLFFLALLSKETAMAFPLLAMVLDLSAPTFLHNHRSFNRWLRFIGLFFVFVPYLMLRIATGGADSNLYQKALTDFSGQFIWLLKAIPSYAGILLFPVNLYFPRSIISLWGGEIVVSLLILFSLVGVIVWGWQRGYRPLVFSLSWVLIGLFAQSLVTTPQIPVAEHRLYLPSVGLAALAALVSQPLLTKGADRVELMAIVLISLVIGNLTFRRNWAWKDDLSISKNAVANSPDHPVALRLLGNAYVPRAKLTEAMELFKKALEVTPNEPRLYESLAIALRAANRDAEALAHYRRAAEVAPHDSFNHWLLGRHYMRLRQFPEAEKALRTSVQLNPRSSEFYNDLALCFFYQQKYQEAVAELRKALEILPSSEILQHNLRQALKRLELQGSQRENNP